MDKSSSTTVSRTRDRIPSYDSENDDSDRLVRHNTRDATEHTTSKNEKSPVIQNANGSSGAVDINNWFHDTRALDRKFDDLIAKLDALIFELDCILGSVSPDAVIKKLAEECRNHGKQMSSTKKSLVGIQGTIRGAYAVCERLPQGTARDRLFNCAKNAEGALKSFAMQSNPPSIRALDASRLSSGSTAAKGDDAQEDESEDVNGPALSATSDSDADSDLLETSASEKQEKTRKGTKKDVLQRPSPGQSVLAKDTEGKTGSPKTQRGEAYSSLVESTTQSE